MDESELQMCSVGGTVTCRERAGGDSLSDGRNRSCCHCRTVDEREREGEGGGRNEGISEGAPGQTSLVVHG